MTMTLRTIAYGGTSNAPCPSANRVSRVSEFDFDGFQPPSNDSPYLPSLPPPRKAVNVLRSSSPPGRTVPADKIWLNKWTIKSIPHYTDSVINDINPGKKGARGGSESDLVSIITMFYSMRFGERVRGLERRSSLVGWPVGGVASFMSRREYPRVGFLRFWGPFADSWFAEQVPTIGTVYRPVCSNKCFSHQFCSTG